MTGETTPLQFRTRHPGSTMSGGSGTSPTPDPPEVREGLNGLAACVARPNALRRIPVIDRLRTAVRPVAIAVAHVLLLGAPAADEVDPRDDPDNAISISVPDVTLAPGGTGEAVVTIKLVKGFGILGDPLPTRWTSAALLMVESSGGVVAKTPVFPEPKKKKDSDGGVEYGTYSGTFEVSVPLEASGKAALGARTLKGRLGNLLTYDGDFYKTKTRPVDIAVRIAAKTPPAAAKRPGGVTPP